MRTFIIRARKGTTRPERVRTQIGTSAHLEIIAHTVMNAFFVSNGFREHVEVYIVLESALDFPRSIKLSSDDGLSIAGFHESAILDLLETALINSPHLHKQETISIAPGLQISGFGFEKLVALHLNNRPVYLLDHKGEAIRETSLAPDSVFILSDHLAMPKNNIKALKRQGMKMLSLGKKILFASQCVSIIHYEMDRAEVN